MRKHVDNVPYTLREVIPLPSKETASRRVTPSLSSLKIAFVLSILVVLPGCKSVTAPFALVPTDIKSLHHVCRQGNNDIEMPGCWEKLYPNYPNPAFAEQRKQPQV